MLRKVQIRNYKSIGRAVVDLSKLTVLVGPNGAGKSNFVDALSFVADSLTDSVELAFKTRGGIGAVRRRSGGHPTHIGIRLIMDLEENQRADYAFEIAAKPGERFYIARERCVVRHGPLSESAFEARKGEFVEEVPGIRPKILPDRLALSVASATPEFRPVYDFITGMRFYSIVPPRLRELQEPDPGDFLKRDGSNAAAVLKRISENQVSDYDRYNRVCRLLSKLVPGLKKVEYRSVGQKETVQFKQDIGLKHPWTFDSLNMSEGTLRVLGILLAVYQPSRPSLIAIEEPEATVHPAVSELLVDVLMEGAKESQVVLTTHSPDILDHKQLSDEQIRVVLSLQGATSISPLAESSRKAVRDKLYTPGELLRADELEADLRASGVAAEQLNLFEKDFDGMPSEP